MSKLNTNHQLKITCLSPVHVGSGVKLNHNTDFLSHQGKIGIIDAAKVFEIVAEHGMDHWVNLIEENKSIIPYIQKLQPDFQLEQISKRVYPQSSETRIQELREQMRTSHGEVLLPGSSLKGSIRTTLWNQLIETDRIQPLAIRYPQRNRINYKDNFLNKVAFAPNSKYERLEPTRDILRFLRLQDVVFDADRCTLEVLNVLTDKTQGWQPKSFHEYAEVISRGSESNVRISIATNLLQKNRRKSFIPNNLLSDEFANVKNLLQTCNKYTTKMLQLEIDFFDQDLNRHNHENLEIYLEYISSLLNQCEQIKEGCIIRLGHGTGYRFMTGNKIMSAQLEEEYVNILRNIRKDFKGRYDEFVYIKSRKMTNSGTPLGFIKLQLQN